MKNNDQTETKPPYGAYKTFTNAIDSLRASGVPDRIDRSIFPGQSGAAQSYLISTFKFLGLTNEDGAPTAVLKDLIANPKNEKAIYAKAIKEKYHFIFNDGFNIQAASEAQLSEKLRDTGLSGETVRKAFSFFVMLCESAGVTLSPHLKTTRKASSGSGSAGRKYKKRKLQETEVLPPSLVAPVNTIHQMLLEKFPAFDPAWEPETQKKWFDSFEKFMKSAGPQTKEG